MKTAIQLQLLIVTLGLAALSAPPQVPGIISHQGKVTVSGINFTGTGQFKFALVNAAGGTTYWSNDGTSSVGSQPTAAVALSVARGIFSVDLGDTTVANMTQTIPASVFANSAVYLRVWFNDGTTGWSLVSPDRRITSVGYALMATTAASANAVAAANVTGTISLAQLPTAVLTNGGTFTGNGAALTNIPASAVVAAPPGMVLIPAGSFTMGDTLDGLPDAVPTNVTVSAFYMDVNLVTSNQWRTIYNWATLVGGYTFVNPGAGKAGDHPVQAVDWYDCVKWCNARSQQAGRTPVYYTDAGLTAVYTNGAVTVYANWTVAGYRLPTEAEWEKAARGGLSGKRFPWGDTISQKLANYSGNTASYAYDLGPNGNNAIGSIGGTSPRTSPVGSFAANGYGLNDMAGNVFQWCWDWYGTPYAGGTDPHGPAGSLCVVRGGAWNNGASLSRCAYRYFFNPISAYLIGFRCVRGL